MLLAVPRASRPRRDHRPNLLSSGRGPRFQTRLSTDRHHVLKAWIAAVLWLIVITVESSNLASSNNTSRILYPLLFFLSGRHPALSELCLFFPRKGGLVFVSGLLIFLLF